MIRFLILFFLLLQVSAHAETVTRVVDGDTLILSETGRVRLSGIDAPEMKQLGGVEAKKFLQIVTADKNVFCAASQKADRYKRTLCELYSGSHNINQVMVLHGWAWDHSHGMYEDDMLEAQMRHLGIWYEGSNNTPPWKWRQLQRQK